MFGLTILEIVFIFAVLVLVIPVTIHTWMSAFYAVRNKGKIELLQQIQELKLNP